MDEMADGERRRYMAHSRWSRKEEMYEDKSRGFDVPGIGLTINGVRRVLSELTPGNGDTWDTSICVWFEDTRDAAPMGYVCTYANARKLFLKWLGSLTTRGDVVCDEIDALVGLMAMSSADVHRRKI